jgi:hypothetical protein
MMYPIIRAERVNDDRVLSTFHDSPENVSQLFLTHGFTYSDEELNDINSESTSYIITHRGFIRFGDSNLHVLDIIKNHHPPPFPSTNEV